MENLFLAQGERGGIEPRGIMTLASRMFGNLAALAAVAARFGNVTAGRRGFCAEAVREFEIPSISPRNMVRTAGLEPARLSALPPQSSVSANSTTCAVGKVDGTPPQGCLRDGRGGEN